MLQGKLSAQGSLSGTLHGAAGLSGSLMGGGRVYPAYDGPVEFEPSEDAQTAETGGTTVLSDISISAVPSDYVGSSVARRASADLTASGATVTAPAGYYAAAASKTVASGTEGTPTASKSVSGHTATVTPTVTNSAGYIQGGTHAGTPVTVSASELVSGTYTVGASGTHDVAEYASASVAAATPTNDSDSEYITSSGARKWRYRPKTIVPTAGWAGQHSASNPINGFWATYDAIPTGTTVTPTTSAQTIGGADTMMEGAVTVAAIPPEYIVPTGTKAISANGEGIDVASYAAVDVDVQPSLQSKAATPSTSQQTIAPDSGYDGLSSVTVDAMPSGSVTPEAPTVDSSNGAVEVGWYQQAGHIPQGYYSAIFYDALSTQAAATITPSTSAQTAVAAGKYTTGAVTVAAMPTGTAGTPTATKGTVSNHSVSVTPSVTNTAGYIAGGTKTGTAVTVSASELVSGSETKTANGTYDVTNLAELVVNVAGSSVKTATGTFTGNSTRTIDVACTFEPDIVYFTSDPGTTASSGTVAAIIVRDMMTATRYRNNSTTNSHYAIPGIANLNTSGSSYSWRATYANSKVTLYCYSNNVRGLLTGGRTYSYTFIKWT